MAGYDYGDVNCWETAWQLYIAELGEKSACSLIGELQFWVRILRQNTERTLYYFPKDCRHLCHDECMALSAISAAQAADTAAGHLAIQYLLGSNNPDTIESVWNAAKEFASALRQRCPPLLPVSQKVVESISTMHLLASSGSKTLN